MNLFANARVGGLILLASLLATPLACAESPPLVAVAASVSEAAAEMAAAFARSGGGEVRLSSGSTGNFVQQIRRGAPFQLLLAADEESVALLQREGLATEPGVPYAEGRLALFVPRGSPVRADPELADLKAALADGRLQRLAIANPEHAPYGRAAREVLQRLGVWSQAQGRLVLGENVAQAAQFAASGSAQAGLVAYSLTLAPGFAERGRTVALPTALHAPLRQSLVLLSGAGDAARAFKAFVLGAEGQAILARHGFAPPR